MGAGVVVDPYPAEVGAQGILGRPAHLGGNRAAPASGPVDLGLDAGVDREAAERVAAGAVRPMDRRWGVGVLGQAVDGRLPPDSRALHDPQHVGGDGVGLSFERVVVTADRQLGLGDERGGGSVADQALELEHGLGQTRALVTDGGLPPLGRRRLFLAGCEPASLPHGSPLSARRVSNPSGAPTVANAVPPCCFAR